MSNDDFPKVYEVSCTDAKNSLTIRRKPSQIPYSVDWGLIKLGVWVDMNGPENYVTYHFADAHQLNKAEKELINRGWSKK